MLKLTRISDGQEYTYSSKEEFLKNKLEEYESLDDDPSHLADLLTEMHDFAKFVKENKVIERLDQFIERYYK